MKTIATALAACLVILLMTGAIAYATVTPSQGTPIGLEHDPEGIVRGKTDDKGNVTFAGLHGSTWLVAILAFKVPVVVTVTSGGKSQTSAPILPGTGEKAYAVDRAGRKLTFDVGKDGQVTVHVETAK